MTLFEQSSYGSREQGNDWTGNSVYLWTVVNAVYLALMGPQGFADARRADPPAQPLRGAADRRAARRVGALGRLLQGVRRRLRRERPHRRRGQRRRCASAAIFGGGDLSASHPQLGQCALYCVTEVHAQEDVDRLVEALAEVTR